MRSFSLCRARRICFEGSKVWEARFDRCGSQLLARVREQRSMLLARSSSSRADPLVAPIAARGAAALPLSVEAQVRRLLEGATASKPHALSAYLLKHRKLLIMPVANPDG
eukprot:4542543-Pleurochrysis_carterae.AAC.2